MYESQIQLILKAAKSDRRTQVSTTMNTYVHGNESIQREAAARIESAVRPHA
jgi:hypothetical protein